MILNKENIKDYVIFCKSAEEKKNGIKFLQSLGCEIYNTLLEDPGFMDGTSYRYYPCLGYDGGIFGTSIPSNKKVISFKDIKNNKYLPYVPKWKGVWKAD